MFISILYHTKLIKPMKYIFYYDFFYLKGKIVKIYKIYTSLKFRKWKPKSKIYQYI